MRAAWEGVSETLIPEHGHGALPVTVEKSFENKPDRPGFHPIAYIYFRFLILKNKLEILTPPVLTVSSLTFFGCGFDGAFVGFNL